MSLSFEDSLKTNSYQENLDENEISTISMMSLEDANVMATSLDLSGWTAITDKDYRFYNNEYGDDNCSIIDDLKNINLDSKQFNITQEQNSQYIPFQMSRYYDGFDLTKAKIQIYYINKDKKFGVDYPVDVYYNDEYIRFAWLVSDFATQLAGNLKFEIQAKGANNKGETYIWKSRINDRLTVLESLETATVGEIGVSEEQLETWYNQITGEIQKATNAAIEAKNYADDASVSAQNATAKVKELEAGIDDKVNEAIANNVNSVIDSKISTELENYYTKSETYTKTEVDNAINSVDISSEIDPIKASVANNASNISNLSTEVEGINTSIDNINTDLSNIHTAIDDLPQTLAEDYYTKSATDEKFATKVELNSTNTNVSAMSSSIESNTSKLSSLATTVGDLQGTISNIDTSPRLTYDVEYNDAENPDVGENVFVFYEIENEGKENEVKEAKKKFTIVGGSGGGGTSSSTLKIGYITTSPLVVTTNDKAIIKYTFSGTDSSGDDIPEGSATWKVNGRIVSTNTAINGENSFDITDYISVGTQKVNLTIVDDGGSLVTKNWTVQKIDVRLESTFNDKVTYPLGSVSFDYTPYGAISKHIHFILDGREIGTVNTSSSGIPMSFDIPSQTHGSHLLESYITAEINGNSIESNHIVKDIIWYDSTSNVPVISTIYQNFTARQYDTTNIECTVYDPTTEMPTVEIAVDDVVVSTLTLSSTTFIYPYKTDVIGEHTITITCGETVKTLTANITKLDIDVSPVTSGLVFDFNPSGKSNNDSDKLWSNGIVSMTVSDNFDWVNGGYQFDENGDQYFCIKAGTSATIDYQLFADDAKKNGKEFKLVFKTTNVKNPNATFLSCVDNTTESNHIGIKMNVHDANIYGQAGSLFLPYSEEDIIEFEFNISKSIESIPMVMGYEDGVSTSPMVYDESYSFTQNNPKTISLGSDDCDLYIYRFKVYNTSLTDRGILNNFIADARNAEEMISRYDRNQIYDENNNLTPEVLAEKCPHLRIIKIEAPYFTNNKSDEVPNTTIECIYKDGDPVLDNWKAYNSMHSGRT